MEWFPQANAGTPPANIQNATLGAWDTVKYNWGRVAVHMALLRGSNSHSQVLFFNGNGGAFGNPAIWKVNPSDALASGAIVDLPISPACTPASNIFCGGHSALADGRVLVTGGDDAQSPGITLGVIYNPVTQAWQCQSQMAEQRWYPTNTTLANGDILVTSGLKYHEMLSFGGLQTTVQNDLRVAGLSGATIWSNPDPGTKPSTRQGHSAVFDDTDAAHDGDGFEHKNRMIIYGGLGSDGLARTDAWQLKRTNLSAWTWSQISPASTPPERTWHSAILSYSGSSMIVFGGLGLDGTARKDVRKLTLTGTPAWSDITPSGGPSERLLHTAVYDPVSMNMVVYGGADHSGTLADDKIWKLALSGTVAWTQTTTTGGPPPRLQGHSAVLEYRPPSSTREMYIFGGKKTDGSFSTETWKLDLGTNVWSQVLPCSSDALPAGRWKHAAIWHETGSENSSRMVIYGGETSTGLSNEVWDLRFHNSCGGSGSGPVWRPRSTAPPARAGHRAVFDTRDIHAVKPERFSGGSWTVLAQNAYKWLSLYPQMFLLPSGNAFYAANSDTTLILEDPGTGSPAWDTDKKPSGFPGGSSVMYLPGKAMKCGGEPSGEVQTAWIDLSSDESNDWQASDDIPEPRARHNLTILPNGKVMLTGGITGSLIGTAKKEPRIWNPLTSPPTWGSLLAPDLAARDYHSTALLLPDGRVLSGGGEDNGSDGATATIFWPPYLWDAAGALATRPQIASLDTILAYGSTFRMCLTDSSNITNVALIKPSAVTHQFNQDQRYVPLSFTSSLNGLIRTLVVTAPTSGAHAPLGDYLLFATKWNGVPAVARWVRMTPGATHAGTITIEDPVWASGEVHHISGDFTVGSGSVLTINSGARVVVAPGAAFKVDGGTLTATGTTFTGSGCSPQWTGIKVVNGTATLTRCVIRDADIGVSFSGGTAGGAITGCRLSNLGTEGIRINNNASITVERDTIDCPANTFIGIHVGTSADGTNTVKRNRIIAPVGTFSNSKGMLIEDVATLSGNYVTGFLGTNCRGIEFNLVAEDTSAACTLTKAASGGGYASDEYPHIYNCTTGIYIAGQSRPSIYATRIDSTTYAFWVTALAQPQIANVETNPGCDVSRSSIRHVRSDTRLSTTPIIKALYNYWGTTSSGDIAAKMGANVDWNPYLGSDPIDGLSRRVLTEPAPQVPVAQLLGNRPNPFPVATEIHFVSPAAGLRVVIQLYDVAGRLVRSAETETQGAGESQWDWDGRDASGAAAPSGIYYYRVQIGNEFVESRKMLLLR